LRALSIPTFRKRDTRNAGANKKKKRRDVPAGRMPLFLPPRAWTGSIPAPAPRFFGPRGGRAHPRSQNRHTATTNKNGRGFRRPGQNNLRAGLRFGNGGRISTGYTGRPRESSSSFLCCGRAVLGDGPISATTPAQLDTPDDTVSGGFEQPAAARAPLPATAPSAPAAR